MTLDTRPDAAADAPDLTGQPGAVDGLGCHSGAERLRAAAMTGDNAELMDRFAADYPKGPHDKPQSMCPAFGSLRVGLRMRRVATVLSGSACCVYGLTFVSHFYGARRSVGYVPFNSESLVTGKLFEDIREAVHKLADPARYDAIVVTNLCVPTASGVPLRLLPKTIDGVRIVGIDVPGFGVPTHAEAKDVLAAAMLAYARAEIQAGPVPAPESARSDRPTVTLLGETFPVDPITIGALLDPLGLAAGPSVPCRAWPPTPRSTAARSRRSIPSIPPACANSRRRDARRSAPPRSAAMVQRHGCRASPTPSACPPRGWRRPRTRPSPRSRQRSPPPPSPAPSPSRATRAPNSWSRAS